MRSPIPEQWDSAYREWLATPKDALPTRDWGAAFVSGFEPSLSPLHKFSWQRDATMTLTAVDWLGHLEESQAFFHWMLACCTVNQFVLHPLATSGDAEEWEHPSWRGYAQSRPVRIGNAARAQRRMDVYGEAMDAVWHYVQQHLSARALVAEIWPLFRGSAEEARQRWMEPDEGIWETRGGAQHFTYSKAQSWVALDRAIRPAAFAGQEGPVNEWEQTLLDEGYDARYGGFMQTLGGTTLDARVLLLPQLGLIDPYGFLVRSTWLVAALALQGSASEARRLFYRLIALAPRGLYAEEHDPQTGQFWRNYSQAFTHLGVITAILHVNQAEDHQGLPLAGKRGWSADEAEDVLATPEGWHC